MSEFTRLYPTCNAYKVCPILIEMVGEGQKNKVMQPNTCNHHLCLKISEKNFFGKAK